MGIKLKTRKKLWGRAANRCAFPNCKRELVMDATETDDESIVGDECHIIARSSSGPRGDSTLKKDQRNNYNNLILLCKVHHKLIDDQENKYTVSKLKKMKVNHEKWVKETLNFDLMKQKDDEYYSKLIEKWEKLSDLDNWHIWTSSILSSGQPTLNVEADKRLYNLNDWLFNRIWPERYKELNLAFENFRRILQDFIEVFHNHAKKVGPKKDLYETEKFYKIPDWDESKYNRLLKKYNYHVDLVQDLLLELTRAANYICHKVREYIIPSFRLEEGMLIVTSGPHMGDFSFRKYKTKYRGNERTAIPYPGLKKFKDIRANRDFKFGVNNKL